MVTRTILHLDLDAFYCAVEEQRDPALRSVPFAVGGRPEERGVVASCSYAARRYGVRSAMPMSRAARLCPDLVIVPPRFPAYHEASERVMVKLHALTPLVEQLSIDEAFLDVTGIPDAGEGLARRLQGDINNQLGLSCSLGVASNKLVAKIANNIGKAAARGDAPPNAVTVVPPGEEAAFLAPLAVEELWGVGPKTAEVLHSMGIRTIGNLAQQPVAALAARFGKHGEDMAARSRGLDDRRVETEHETKSISKETTFARDVRDGDVLRRALRQLSEGVGRQLRKSELRGATVKLKLRWADFTTLTRQTTLPFPTDDDAEIYATAAALFEATWHGQAVRLIGVGVSGFEAEGRQMSLWESATLDPQRRLQAALDTLRDRFGDDAIRRVSDLEEDDLAQ